MTMKKICTFFAGLTLLFGNVQAQCTPDAQFTSLGLYPNPLTSVVKDSAYNQTLTVVLPYKRDTTLNLPAPVGAVNIKAEYRSWKVDSVFDLPRGVMAPNSSCNTANCVINVPFMANAKGCLQASGTPDTSGTFNVKIRCTGNGYILSPISFPLLSPPISAGDTINFDDPRLNSLPTQVKGFITQAKQVDYTTTMAVTVDRAEKMDLVNSWSFYPNPAQANAFVAINLSNPAVANISMVDLTGKEVFVKQTALLNQGNHQINIERPASGLFLLKLEVNGQHQSRLVSFE